MDTAAHRALDRVAASWPVRLGADQADDLVRFGALLLQWNARINLTGAKSLDGLIDEHFPDAFAVASLLDGSARVVDVGSGGGLPAVPLALLRPGLQVSLVEPLAKKAAFLRTAVRELQLSTRVAVEPCRAEDLPDAGFDVAMSRATFAPGAWARIGARLVRAGGRVLVLTVPGTEVPGRRITYYDGRRVLIDAAVEECST